MDIRKLAVLVSLVFSCSMAFAQNSDSCVEEVKLYRDTLNYMGAHPEEAYAGLFKFTGDAQAMVAGSVLGITLGGLFDKLNIRSRFSRNTTEGPSDPRAAYQEQKKSTFNTLRENGHGLNGPFDDRALIANGRFREAKIAEINGDPKLYPAKKAQLISSIRALIQANVLVEEDVQRRRALIPRDAKVTDPARPSQESRFQKWKKGFERHRVNVGRGLGASFIGLAISRSLERKFIQAKCMEGSPSGDQLVKAVQFFKVESVDTPCQISAEGLATLNDANDTKIAEICSALPDITNVLAGSIQHWIDKHQINSEVQVAEMNCTSPSSIKVKTANGESSIQYLSTGSPIVVRAEGMANDPLRKRYSLQYNGDPAKGYGWQIVNSQGLVTSTMGTESVTSEALKDYFVSRKGKEQVDPEHKVTALAGQAILMSEILLSLIIEKCDNSEAAHQSNETSVL